MVYGDRMSCVFVDKLYIRSENVVINKIKNNDNFFFLNSKQKLQCET